MRLSFPFKVAGIAGLIFSLECELAFALLPTEVPASVAPEQVSRSLRTQQAPSAPVPVSPAVVEQKPTGPAGSPEAQKIKFKLNKIILKGNHVYSDAQLSALYKDKIGKQITVAELFEIVQSITNYYRNTGYIISRAILPPQHVKDGIVTIQIIEGYIDNVSVSGTPHGAKCLQLAYAKKIKECPPLQISRMERYLLIANETPGTSSRAVLSPSKTKTGAADLTLVTENKYVTGYVSYDNYGTQYIGPQQMTANVALNSIIASGDTGQITATKTPKGGELTYLDANYNMAVSDEGTRWSLGSTYTHTHPLFVLREDQVDGLNNNYYTGLQYPFIRTRSQYLTLKLGFNMLDTVTTSLGAPLYTDHVRSIDFGETYNFSDSWYGANMISADFRQGLPILGYTSDYSTAALTSRPGGRGDYTKITLQMNRLQAIKGPWSIYGAFAGQWAFNPLLSSEQYTFGGSVMGRGYDVAEIIGDRGVGGTLELRYDLAIGKIIDSLQFYTFYDGGEIWNKIVTPATVGNVSGSPAKISATSAGIGSRFYFTKYISGNLMWTQTLTKQVAAEEIIGDGRRPRVFFSIVAAMD
jgi:hemolysin activation/secretion protein